MDTNSEHLFRGANQFYKSQRGISMKILLAAISFVLVVSVNVAAQDGKYYAPGNCTAYKGDGKKIRVGNLYNNSTSQKLEVLCPLVKDTWGNIRSGFVEYRDASSGEDVICSLWSRYNKNNSRDQGRWHQKISSHGSEDKWRKLNFTTMSAAREGYYYFYCEIPKKSANKISRIGAYHINENN